MQQHKILLNRFYTSTTFSEEYSNIQQNNNYYSRKIDDFDGVVDYSNVRSFFENEKNQKVINMYFSFLTGNTRMNDAPSYLSNSQFVPSAEFKSIYYNDEKLADSFNEYYGNYILNMENTYNNTVENSINKNLTETKYNIKTKQFFNNNYRYDDSIWVVRMVDNNVFSSVTLSNKVKQGKNRIPNLKKYIVKETIDESYFISIFLDKTQTQMSMVSMDYCLDSDLLNCFVNPNYNFDEDSYWKYDNKSKDDVVNENTMENVQDVSGNVSSVNV